MKPDGATCATTFGIPDNLKLEVTRQSQLLGSLASALQSTINPPAIGVRAGLPLEAGWRQFGGKNYIIVVNPSSQFTLHRIEVTGFTPSAPFVVVGENRTAGSAGSNEIPDNFNPYAVHIYRTP